MPDTSKLHAEQVEYWNGAGGARWIAQQDRRDAMLGNFTHGVLVKADPKPGESVVDIGCGCGETSVELARKVGAMGHVLAADVSAPILACAKERLRGYPQAEAVVADASSHVFDTSAADLLFSRFGVMFFGDPVAAFKNLRVALKPTGRLVFGCWRTPAENVWMTGPLEATYKHVPPPDAVDPFQPGPFAFANPARVAGILTAAGFTAPSFDKIDTIMDMSGGGGIEGAVTSAMELGPTSRVLEGQDKAVKDAVAVSMRDYFSTRLVDGEVAMPAAIWVVSSSPSAV